MCTTGCLDQGLTDALSEGRCDCLWVQPKVAGLAKWLTQHRQEVLPVTQSFIIGEKRSSNWLISSQTVAMAAKGAEPRVQPTAAVLPLQSAS